MVMRSFGEVDYHEWQLEDKIIMVSEPSLMTKPERDLKKKLAAIRAAAEYQFPAPDIETMLAEIERGYLSDPSFDSGGGVNDEAGCNNPSDMERE